VNRRTPAATHAILLDSSKCAGVTTWLPIQMRGATDGSRRGFGFASRKPGRHSETSALRIAIEAGLPSAAYFAMRSSTALTVMLSVV
jgi:hypothetical protein